MSDVEWFALGGIVVCLALIVRDWKSKGGRLD